MAKKRKARKQPVAHFSQVAEKKLPLVEQSGSSSHFNNLKKEQEIEISRNLFLAYENQFIQLKEQNNILTAQKNELAQRVTEYEKLYKTWEIERKNLLNKTQRAVQQAENTKLTKSFRLGYALIFGFKSWQGFKGMIKTLCELYREKNNKKPTISLSFDGTYFNEPQKKLLALESQKPVLQWEMPFKNNKLTHYTTIALQDSQEQVLLLGKENIYTTIDCSQFNQLVVSVNVFSQAFPEQIKQSLLTVAFYDEKGNVLPNVLNLPFSQRLNKHYFYLNANENLADHIFLLVPTGAVKAEFSLALWDAKAEIYYKNALNFTGFSNGISVILPTYKGEKTIIKCLESLAKQTLPMTAFEVLVVINGEQDNTPTLIEKFKQKAPHLNIRVFELEEGNVSKARNYAIQQAKKGWTTFIDDDDFVPENYLSGLYQYALYNAITITGIEDIQDGQVIRSSVMNQLDNANKKDQQNYFDVTSSLTMNACKLAPTYMVKSIHYDSSLKSGEDVVYWCRLLNQFRPKTILIPSYQEDSYKRLIRENSISRKAESYDFNVYQRLEVIKLLIEELKVNEYQQIDKFIQSKIDAQSNFIKNYLKKYPAEYQRYIQDVEKLEIHNEVVGKINSLFTETLVVSYCFAPYIDTSGVVMSKRIKAMGKPVDLISNSMDRVRQSDKRLLQIAEYALGNHYELKAPQTFSNWNAIATFAEYALDATNQMLKKRVMYKKLYSRAMWPASHIAAALIKMKYPQMKWTAEFSDPILKDVSAEERLESFPTDWLERQGFIPQDHGLGQTQNVFYWCEKLPYLYADELIFTNQNQLDYMLSYADDELKEKIIQKAVILPQPTLERKFYQLSEMKLEKESGKFHLAYFGSFYVNRGFKPFIDAWSQLPDDEKYRLKLHIYTQQDEETIMSSVPDELKTQVIIQKYVDYFDFLALSDQFDGLVVMDAQTEGLKLNNPYLPSKLSDYLGSSATTLALCEQGSPMSQIESEKLIKVSLSDLDNIKNILFSLILKVK